MNIQHQLRKLRCHGKVYNWSGGKVGVGGGTKTNESSTTTTNIDNRSIVTNTIDAGAIENALGFASRVSDNQTANTRDMIRANQSVLDAGQSMFDTAATTVGDTANRSLTGYQNLFDIAVGAIGDQASRSNTGYQNLFDQAVDAIATQSDKNRTGYRDVIDMAIGAIGDQADKNRTSSQNMFDTTVDTIASQARQNSIGMQNVWGTAVDTISIQADKNRTGMSNLFDTALGFVGDAVKGVSTAYDKSSAAQAAASGELKAAYADAKGTSDSQKQIILALLAVAGIAVAAPLLMKGSR